MKTITGWLVWDHFGSPVQYIQHKQQNDFESVREGGKLLMNSKLHASTSYSSIAFAIFGFNAPRQCLVRVCLLQCMCVRFRNGNTWVSAKKCYIRTCTRQWQDALKPKRYSLVKGNQTTARCYWPSPSTNDIQFFNIKCHQEWPKIPIFQGLQFSK